MKKRILILTIILLVVSLPLMAEDFGQGRDMGAGHTKLGTIVGNGLWVTAGFDTGGVTEINVFGGIGWYNYAAVGANMLFTLVDINISDNIFPLSLGPQVNLGFGYYGDLSLDVLAVIRWEYTFWFPLNLFIEYGAGIGIDFGYSSPLGFAWTSGVGVRYVFGM